MEMQKYRGKKIAILATNGFEETELTVPKKELENNGAIVLIVSDKPHIHSWKYGDWGNEFNPDVMLDNADAGSYNAIIIPGGAINIDRLRKNRKAVMLVKAFFDQKKVVASISHATQILIDLNILQKQQVTSFPSIGEDIANTGATWNDSAVIKDEQVVTGQNTSDISGFMKVVDDLLADTP